MLHCSDSLFSWKSLGSQKKAAYGWNISLSIGVEKWKAMLLTSADLQVYPQQIQQPLWTLDGKACTCTLWVCCAVTSVLSVSTPLQGPLSMPKHQNRFSVSQTMELMQKLLTSFPSTLMRHWCHFSTVHGGFLVAVVLQQNKMLLHIHTPWSHPSCY